MLTTPKPPTIRSGQWAMICAVDFKKIAFCTLFVEDGVAERVALDLRLHGAFFVNTAKADAVAARHAADGDGHLMQGQDNTGLRNDICLFHNFVIQIKNLKLKVKNEFKDKNSRFGV